MDASAPHVVWPCAGASRMATARTFAALLVLGLAGIAAAGRGTQMASSSRSETRAKVLNNFVTELVNASGQFRGPEEQYRFRNRRDGWVYISTTAAVEGGAKVYVSLDANPPEQAVIVHEAGSAETLETMRYLSAGEHTLRLRWQGKAPVTHIVVRAVPEIIYCKFPSNPQVTEYGPYDWSFLSRHILPNVNTIVGSGAEADRRYVEQWKARGGRWIVECGLPGLGAESVTADQAYSSWASNPGFQDPLLDGVIVDEFGGAISARESKKYGAWTAALQRLYTERAGKLFYPYCGELYRYEASRHFAETVMRHGGRFAFERYLREQPTEEEAAAFLNHMLGNEMFLWQRTLPGSVEHMIVCLGYLCAPPESLNCNPSVNYKVYLDRQFNLLATHPNCAGLYGIMEYTASYADEEIVRWTGKLYRHYCIEGRRERLTDDPYILPHLENPDFANGVSGWTLSPAEEGSIGAGNMPGFSWLEGRYPRNRQGDDYLRTRRSAAKPNTFSQTLQQLQPGRLYSLKMYTADLGDLSAGRSVQQKHAVSIAIEGGETIPEKSFQHVFPNCYDHFVGPFDSAEHRAWMNYHQRVFRATAAEARLVISDWAGDQEPGGPIGQELMYNFIEVEPYLAE